MCKFSSRFVVKNQRVQKRFQNKSIGQFSACQANEYIERLYVKLYMFFTYVASLHKMFIIRF